MTIQRSERCQTCLPSEKDISNSGIAIKYLCAVTAPQNNSRLTRCFPFVQLARFLLHSYRPTVLRRGLHIPHVPPLSSSRCRRCSSTLVTAAPVSNINNYVHRTHAQRSYVRQTHERLWLERPCVQCARHTDINYSRLHPSLHCVARKPRNRQAEQRLKSCVKLN